MAYSARSHAFLGMTSPTDGMCLGTLGLICAEPEPEPDPDPEPEPEPEPELTPTLPSGGGPGHVPFLFPMQPGLPGGPLELPEDPPSPEDLKRRAKTLAAALAASIDGDDEATKLAATLALLLAELDDSS